MDMIIDLHNLDIMIQSEIINPIERELANTIEGSTNHCNTESNSHFRGKSLHENEIRDFGHENAIPRHDMFLDSMETFTNEFKLRLSQDVLDAFPN